jgi:hypothetical protein
MTKVFNFLFISQSNWNAQLIYEITLYCICACISRTFLTIYTPELGCRYHIDDWAHDADIVCCGDTPPPPPVETVSSRHHRLSIDSQKSEDCDITDKLLWMLLATTKVPRMQSHILLSHRQNQVQHITSYYYFRILDLKIWVRLIHAQIRYSVKYLKYTLNGNIYIELLIMLLICKVLLLSLWVATRHLPRLI